jgi:hypothetical protein
MARSGGVSANGPPHTYNVRGQDWVVLAGTLPQVTFRSDDPSLPPPNPRYLALHVAMEIALICRE